MYSKRPDKDWGLTDCASFAVMADRRLTDALTADDHFRQAGSVPFCSTSRPPPADNPAKNRDSHPLFLCPLPPAGVTSEAPPGVCTMSRLTALCLVVALAPPAAAQVFTDDFNDGNDNGWSRYDPIAGFGAPNQFSFPAGGYRIQAAQSPLPATIGQGRAGSFRQDLSYTNFFARTDVVAWNNTINQGFGLGARISSPGLGSTNGYLLLYFPAATTPGFSILRITGEVPASPALASLAMTLDPSHQYRFEFSGTGSALLGQAFDLTVAPGVPLFSLPATDATYGSGFSGLSSVANTATGTSDATFDNYFSASAVPEPGTLALCGLGAAGWAARRRAVRRR